MRVRFIFTAGLLAILAALAAGCGEPIAVSDFSRIDVHVDEDSDLDEDVPAQEPVILSGAYLNCQVPDPSSVEQGLAEVTCQVLGAEDTSAISSEALTSSLTVSGGNASQVQARKVDGVWVLSFFVPENELSSVKDISVKVSLGAKSMTIETVTTGPLSASEEDPEDSRGQEQGNNEAEGSEEQVAAAAARALEDGGQEVETLARQALAEITDDSKRDEIQQLSAEALEQIAKVQQEYEDEFRELKSKYQEEISEADLKLALETAKLKEKAAAEIKEIQEQFETEVAKLSDSGDLSLHLADDGDPKSEKYQELQSERDKKIREIKDDAGKKLLELQSENTGVKAKYAGKWSDLKEDLQEKVQKIRNDLRENVGKYLPSGTGQ